MNIRLIIDYVFIGLGIYALYTVFQMKTTGELTGKMFFSVHTPMERCKDKAGLIAFITPKLIVVGSLTVIMGVTNLIVTTKMIEIPDFIPVIERLALIVALLWFGKSMKIVQKKYW
jgi:hypothetical protein